MFVKGFYLLVSNLFVALLRGAELVHDHVRSQLDAVRQEDKRKMDRIKKS